MYIQNKMAMGHKKSKITKKRHHWEVWFHWRLQQRDTKWWKKVN